MANLPKGIAFGLVMGLIAMAVVRGLFAEREDDEAGSGGDSVQAA